VRYRPAWYLPSPHLATLWARFAHPARTAEAVRRAARVERWETPDGDFVDVARIDASDPAAPRLVLLHGLEGSLRSHYVAGILDEARRRGWGAALLIFRGCGEEPNRTPRFYHSGETGDLGFVLGRVAAEREGAPLLLAGVSLGGNVLLKWLGEQGALVDAGEATHPAYERVAAAAAVSVPYDLARAARHIDRGFSRVYQWSFLRSLRRKALEKLARYPDLADPDAVRRARNIWEFDDALTAPLHGFRDAADYYARSSAIGWIAHIRVRTLLLSAVDDPFLPSEVLAEVGAIARGNPALVVEFPRRGGHVGFVSGRNPLRSRFYAEWRVPEFLAGAVDARARTGTGSRG
jgi:predicted alpha/beta-fold hydrolase